MTIQCVVNVSINFESLEEEAHDTFFFSFYCMFLLCFVHIHVLLFYFSFNPPLITLILSPRLY